MSKEHLSLTANYAAVAEYCGVDYSRVVPALVETWDNAASPELKDSICRSEVIQELATETTLSVFYKLYFEKLVITVLKIFVMEAYDRAGTQEHFFAVDAPILVVGIKPIMNETDD